LPNGRPQARTETVDAEWDLKALRRLARVAHEDRANYRSARTTDAQATTLSDQRKYALAQPLYEKVLQICRRLLTDEHPHSATSYHNPTAHLMQRFYANLLGLPPGMSERLSKARALQEGQAVAARSDGRGDRHRAGRTGARGSPAVGLGQQQRL
jgi:hypothetical protein